jgi:hypothetical protein
MTDSELRELDAQIAVEVFGDTLVKVHKQKSDPLEVMRKTRRGELGIFNRFFLEDGTKLYCGRPFAPEKIECYSTDIRAAWEVVEKLTGGMIQFRLERTNSGRTYAKFVDCHEPETVTGRSADTAPLAICLAALDAVRTAQ